MRFLHSGTISAEHLYSSDDIEAANDIMAGGNIITGGDFKGDALWQLLVGSVSTGIQILTTAPYNAIYPYNSSQTNWGTSTSRWNVLYTETADINVSATIGTMTISGGSITDSSDTINFGDENLTTSGNISTTSLGQISTAGIIIGPTNTIIGTTGTVNFLSDNLLTTGNLTANDVNAASVSTNLIELGASLLNFNNTDTTSGNRNLWTWTQDSDVVWKARRYESGATDILDIYSNSTLRLWAGAGGDKQMVLNASQFVFDTRPGGGGVFFNDFMSLSRTGEADATNNQFSSYEFVFQTSLWDGSVKGQFFDSIRATASSTTDEARFIDIISNRNLGGIDPIFRAYIEGETSTASYIWIPNDDEELWFGADKDMALYSSNVMGTLAFTPSDANTDITFSFVGTDSTGAFSWMEDEDYFSFFDDLFMNGKAITDLGTLAFNSATELTISSGAVTVTQGHHKIDTEADADNDDLDTINGGNAGEILLILPANSERTVRLRNGVGNIFLKHQVDSHHLSFSSPSGPGAATRYSGGGYYDFSATDVTLNQGSLTQTFGTANTSYAAHASIVVDVNGTVDTGTVSIVVSGTSIDDEKNRQAGDSETILADITTAGTNGYHETVKKWLGTITYTLTETVDDPTAYTINFNYGFSKYEDFGNQSFTVTGLQVVGEAGASDTDFNMILFHHSPVGWTYAAAGFVPGGTQLANMNTDHSTEKNLSNSEPFAWKRVDLNTDIDGDNGEGIVFRVDTTAAKAVESMSGVIWVHTQPAHSYLSDTKQHLIFMKHGPNWLEL